MINLVLKGLIFVLDLASNSYSEEEISVDDSRHSSCPTYTIY